MKMQLLSVVTCCLSQVAYGGTIQIGDGTFASSDWMHDSSGSAGGGHGTATVNQIPAGGNPGEFRRHRNQSTSGGFNNHLTNSWNFYTARPYDPAAEGSIDSLDYSEESVAIQGGTMSGTIALRQGNFLYRPIPTFTTTSSTTQWQQHTIEGLTADDFSLYFFDSNQWIFIQTAHPDFSVSGSPIEFGYFRSNNIGNHGQYDVYAGIDNWQVTLRSEPVPEPCASLLLFVAAAGVVRQGVQRSRHR